MLKKAHVRTRLVTSTEAGEETITTQATGGCLIDESGIMLRYAEAGNNGTATLVVADTLAQLRRTGDVTSRLTFVENQLIPADYSVMQRKMDFSVFTHSHSFLLNSQGGRLEVRFSLLLASAQVADNTLEICWDFKS